MHQHQCIKCKQAYTDSDLDAYYCPSCLAEKQQIAQVIDSKFAGRVGEHVESQFAEYDRLQKEAQKRGQRFPSISDMGISL